MRAIIDVNVLISYLLAGRLDAPIAGSVITVVRGAFQAAYTLLLPEVLLDELASAVHRHPYLARHIEQEDVRRLSDLLRAISEPASSLANPIPSVSRDPKDDYLLAHALVGEADYLVTGDRDLLVLQKVLGVRIVSPQQFAAILEAVDSSTSETP